MQNELGQLNDDISNEIVLIINDTTKATRRSLSAAAPRVTGRLRQSIRIIRRAKKDKKIGMVGFDRKIAPHAHLVLFGTQDRIRKSGGGTGAIPANNFLTPVAEQMRLQFLRQMRRAVK